MSAIVVFGGAGVRGKMPGRPGGKCPVTAAAAAAASAAAFAGDT